MDRADRIGLPVALGGHVALFAILSLGLAWRTPPPVKAPVQTMDVQLVDAVGLQSAAPEPATEAPRAMEAPDAGTPAEAPPPEPTPAPAPQPARPAPPEPEPVPEKPVPAPKPAPPKPVPVPKPVAKPVAKPEPKPVEAKPTPAVKPTPAKPSPAKAAPAAKPATSLSDILKDVRSAAKSERPGSNPDAKAGKAAAQRLGPDFLKGVLGASAAGKGTQARAALSGAAMNGLGAAIKRQIQPCYDLGGLGGTPAMQITTVLQLRFAADGSVVGTPQLVEQTGVDDGNRAYAKQMVEVSRRAVLRCAPLKLPTELYAGGWENITMGFIPGQMR